MKTQRIALLLCMAVAFVGVTLKGISEAQENKRSVLHRIVLEVTTEREESWQAILNNVENVQKALGREQTHIEVVAHGKSLSLFLASNAPLKERLERISKTGVVFAACENTMRRKNVKKEDVHDDGRDDDRCQRHETTDDKGDTT